MLSQFLGAVDQAWGKELLKTHEKLYPLSCQVHPTCAYVESDALRAAPASVQYG